VQIRQLNQRGTLRALNRLARIEATLLPIILAALTLTGCEKEEFQIEKKQCSASNVAETAELWGYRLLIRPAQGQNCHRLLEPGFDWFMDPPMSLELLQARWGEPKETWKDHKGRPFVKYSVEEGEVQFGLEAERSGSLLHQAWRLRLQLRSPRPPSQVLEKSALECSQELIPQARTMLILNDDNKTKATLWLDGGSVTGFGWSRNVSPDKDD